MFQVRLADDYSNLTAKSVALLHWTWRHCADAELVLKCDDDVFVNVRRLAAVAGRVASFDQLHGTGAKGERPVRIPGENLASPSLSPQPCPHPSSASPMNGTPLKETVTA